MPPSPVDLPPFLTLGPGEPRQPVLIAVPHAGRAYPDTLIAAARVPRAVLEGLEDRLADLLVADAVAAGATALVATRPRAWIDLNRSEREIDRRLVSPPPAPAHVEESAKVLGGLGLIPRRAPGGVDLWRRTLSPGEVAARIAQDHRPWHAAVERWMSAARARFGVAVLLDLHSMPPLPEPRGGAAAARLVVGDRHGASAASALREAAVEVGRAAGITVAVNAPYAGGETLARHGRPHRGCHAIQVELDRRLYLDANLHQAGEGLAACRALVADLADALADRALSLARPIAAE